MFSGGVVRQEAIHGQISGELLPQRQRLSGLACSFLSDQVFKTFGNLLASVLLHRIQTDRRCRIVDVDTTPNYRNNPAQELKDAKPRPSHDLLRRERPSL